MIGGDVCTGIAQRRGGDGVEIFHGMEVVQQGVARKSRGRTSSSFLLEGLQIPAPSSNKEENL